MRSGPYFCDILDHVCSHTLFCLVLLKSLTTTMHGVILKFAVKVWGPFPVH